MLDVCSLRLRGVAKLNLDEMHLAGYGDDTPEIDVCAGLAQSKQDQDLHWLSEHKEPL
jgi:hypothetical protein